MIEANVLKLISSFSPTQVTRTQLVKKLKATTKIVIIKRCHRSLLLSIWCSPIVLMSKCKHENYMVALDRDAIRVFFDVTLVLGFVQLKTPSTRLYRNQHPIQ